MIDHVGLQEDGVECDKAQRCGSGKFMLLGTAQRIERPTMFSVLCGGKNEKMKVHVLKDL